MIDRPILSQIADTWRMYGAAIAELATRDVYVAQTPQQRRANEKYAKHEALKRGKPRTTTTKQTSKPSLSTGWVALLAFVVCGGLIFEILRVVPELWSAIVGFFNRLLA
ncbi:hypothetical protein BDV19DRAFT_390411 [Aspergillus venezuelensis]